MASSTDIVQAGDPTSSVTMVNETEFSDSEVWDAAVKQHPEIAALDNWYRDGHRASAGLFQRDKYTTPQGIFEKMQVAIEAVRQDDVVSGVADTTEQLAFKRIAMETDNDDEENVWQQMVDRLDLPSFMRKIWREVFTVSQAYPAVIYDTRDFRVKGKSPKGNKRKKQFSEIMAPVGLTLLDPLKVVPVGSFMFGQEKLAYIADSAESKTFDSMLEQNSEIDDFVIRSLVTEKYKPSHAEARELNKLTGRSGQNISNRLYLLNSQNVWRITSTRSDYERFADIRMESVFQILDLKHQLHEMDRAALIGTTNSIILVKKGTDDKPAKSAEIQQLASQVKTSSRFPVIVGDHRTEIEIITPKTDKTLAAERYNGIDSRLTSRLYQLLASGNYASGTATDDSMKLLRMVASSMEARRDAIRDSLMEHVFYPVYYLNDDLEDEPAMQFFPRRIALDFDKTIAEFMQDLRDRGDISRETILAELDIDEEREAVKRQREAEKFDDIFTPTNVPFSPQGNGESNDPRNSPRTAGRRQGGSKNGGGNDPGTNTSEE